MVIAGLPVVAGPLQPGPGRAHGWLERELSRPEYHPGLVERVLDWVGRLLVRAQDAGGSLAALGWPALVVLVLILAGGLAWVLSRLRDNPAVAPEQQALFDDVRRSAADHRRLAHAAYDAGTWDTAVVEGVRAVAAGLVERHLADDVPAATAHEVTAAAGGRFPDLAARLDAAALVFDETRYGGRPATAARARAVLDLERDLAAATPAGGSTAPVLAVPR